MKNTSSKSWSSLALENGDLLINHENIDKFFEFIFKEFEERCKQKRWLSPEEFENEFGFKIKWQAKERMSNSKSKLPFSKVCKHVLYDRNKIDKWLEKHEVRGVN